MRCDWRCCTPSSTEAPSFGQPIFDPAWPCGGSRNDRPVHLRRRLGDPDADALLDALRAAVPDGLTRTEIRDTVFQRHKTSESIARMLRTLAAAGLAHERTEPTGGRPAERWLAGRAPTT